MLNVQESGLLCGHMWAKLDNVWDHSVSFSIESSQWFHLKWGASLSWTEEDEEKEKACYCSSKIAPGLLYFGCSSVLSVCPAILNTLQNVPSVSYISLYFHHTFLIFLMICDLHCVCVLSVSSSVSHCLELGQLAALVSCPSTANAWQLSWIAV